MIKKIKKKVDNQLCKINTVVELRKNLKSNQENFDNGKYFFLLSPKPIAFLKNENTLKFLDSASRSSISNFRANIWKFINHFINVDINSNIEKKYNGELLMIDRNNNIKVFDFEKNHSFIIMDEFREYKNLYEVNQEMHDIYNIPFIKFYDEKKIITEKYIDFDKVSNWNNDKFYLAIKEVIEGIKKTLIKTHSKSFQSREALTAEFWEKNTNTEYGKLVIDLIPNGIKDENFSVIRSHGDMNFNNLLSKNGIFYLIDWDESRDTVFFYDFFHMIFADWKWSLEPYFIKGYFDGEYDELLADMFIHSNQLYNMNNKKIYLSIYLMNRYLMFENSSVQKLNDTTKLMTIRGLKNLKFFDSY